MPQRTDAALIRLVAGEGECDLSRASFDRDLSGAALHKSTAEFFATIDKLGFRSATEVVTTVLSAHGYALNLENTIACLDDLRFGLRVRLVSASPAHTPPAARAFAPCIFFHLPSKKRVGPLLEKFYSEIEAYEAELGRLHGRPHRSGDKHKTVAELRKEVDGLAKENAALRAKVAELTVALAEAQRSRADATRALEAQNVMPPNVRLATVRAVDFDSRHVTLRSARLTFGAPLGLFAAIPEPETECLVHLVGGSVDRVFLLEQEGRQPETRLAEVLFVDANACKLRDSTRRNWVFRAENPIEENLILQLARGDRVIVCLHEDHLVRLELLGDPPRQTFSDRVREAVAKNAIERHAAGGGAPDSRARDNTRTRGKPHEVP